LFGLKVFIIVCWSGFIIVLVVEDGGKNGLVVENFLCGIDKFILFGILVCYDFE
jgi:hypothetical protein